MFEYKEIQIRWYGHDTFTLQNNILLCVDPYQLDSDLSPDIILISHNHFDHLSIDDLSKISTERTIIISAKECVSQLSKLKSKEIIGLEPNEERSISGIKVKSVPAYNLDKINPDTKKPFHPKEDGKIGFFITIGGITVYHTGDSDLIPEMNGLKPDVALIPVSGTYVMTAKEAASAVDKIQPRIAIPMHYGTIVGSDNDAKEFKNLVKSCEVQILAKE